MQAMLSLLFCSLEVASAGILIARQQIGFLVGAMAVSLAVMGAYCGAVRAQGWGLPGVWWGELPPRPPLPHTQARARLPCPAFKEQRGLHAKLVALSPARQGS
jgi:hypothetical protein